MVSMTGLPLVAADLTWAPLRRGRAVARRGGWDEDREPVVGEHVLVSDGGDPAPYEAVITEVRPDGSFVLSVLAFAAAPASP